MIQDIDHRKPSDGNSNQKPVTDVDSVLNKIKPYGRYQMLMTFIYSYNYFTLDINNLFMGYGGVKPKWICANQSIYPNGTDPNIPTKNCDIFNACPRDNLTFKSDFYSIVSEWSLVCKEEYFMDLITSIQMVGVLLGALLIGPITDFYGRKWIFFGVLSTEFFFGSLSAVSTSATMFLVFRFLIGLCVGAEMVVGWVFTAESTTNRFRFFSRTIATVFLPMWNQVFIAYLTQHWKWYSLVGNLEAVPLLPILALFSFESPRWLAQKGRTEEAVQILQKIARFNRASHLMPENIQLEVESAKTSANGPPKKYMIWHLFATRRLAMYSLVSVATWFAIGLAHYGMYFDIGNLPQNLYLNGAVLAAVDMIVIPLALLDVYNSKLSRKYLMVALFMITALCNVLVVLFQTVVPAGRVSDGLLSFCSILGQVANEASFDVAYVYSIELFPTLLRSNANGLTSMSARLGAVIAPQILYASKTWKPLPYVIFGAISVFGAVIDALFLPNTKNMHLPETYANSNHLT